MLSSASVVAVLAAVASLTEATPLKQRDCVFTVKTMADVAKSKTSGCSTVEINALTVPDKTILDFKNMPEGTIINLKGNLNLCGKTPWADGPCMAVSGKGLTFNGNGYELYGNGESFWDTYGGNGGVDKPKFLSVTMSGTFSNVKVRNTPRHTFSVGNTLPLTISKVNIDNSAGNTLMKNKDDKTLARAHNTDAFDVSATGTTIQDCVVDNQDDCLAVNKGSNIKFLRNSCNGGHGISIGSIATGSTVSQVLIQGNTVMASSNGLRIKTISDATNAKVSDITYTDNHVSGCTDQGVVIRQDYLNGGPTGTATDSVPITNVSFKGKNTVAVVSGAQQVLVLCGQDTCTGTWDWSGLSTSGGTVANSVTPKGKVPITGYSI